MKLAVMSDIHGNHFAFDAVLADIAEEKADKILILGDIITHFAQGTRVILDTIRGLDAEVIRGNREYYMIGQTNGEYSDTWSEYKQFSTSLHTWEQLREEDVVYIESLPAQRSLQYSEELSIRMVHGSPFSEFELLLEEKTEAIHNSLAAIDEKILLCGHTHRQMLQKHGDKTICNPGSVGNNFSGKPQAQYATIEERDGEIVYIMKNVLYDLDAFKRSCDTDNFWVRMILKSIEDGENYNMRFLDEAKKRGYPFPIPNHLYDELADEWIANGVV